MQNLKRNFILIGLITLFVFIPFKNSLAADCKDILIYVFPGLHSSAAFDGEIVGYLIGEGYNVTTMTRGGADELTPALLSSYGQIWIIDTGDDQPNITPAEIANLVNYYNAGGNILLIGEECWPLPHCVSVHNDVDAIAQAFSTNMGFGPDGTEHPCSNINPTASADSAFILSGISTITTSGDNSNVFITTTNPNVKSVAVSTTGIDIIYILDEPDPKGKIVFHPSYFTFIDSTVVTNINDCDSAQYTKNVANWFCGVAPPPSPTFFEGLVPCGRHYDNPDTDNVNESDECTICHFFYLIKNLIDFVAGIAVVVAILFIAFGGVMYIGSTGNEAMLSKAKGIILWAIVGFVLIFTAYIIIGLILSTFGYTNPLGGEWDVIC